MRKRFCPQEDEYIIANYNRLPCREIAKELKRTYASVHMRMHTLKNTQLNVPLNKPKPQIHIPVRKGATNKWVHKLLELQVGGSFTYPANEENKVNTAKRQIPQYYYKTRWEDETSRLVWRVY